MKFSVHFDTVEEMQEAMALLTAGKKSRAKQEVVVATPKPVAVGSSAPEAPPEPEVTPASEETEATSKPKRYRGRRKFKKIDKVTWPIEDCIAVAGWQSRDENGQPKGTCAVALVYSGEGKHEGKTRMAFIDKDGTTASTNTEWYADPNDDRLIDKYEATVDNAILIEGVYGKKK